MRAVAEANFLQRDSFEMSLKYPNVVVWRIVSKKGPWRGGENENRDEEESALELMDF